jgi:hypothetical protein
VDKLETITLKPVNFQPLPSAERIDDTYTHEVGDGLKNLLCHYQVLDYGDDDNAPTVRLVSIEADFGGRSFVNVELRALSGQLHYELETLCSEHCADEEAKRLEDARNGLVGGL